MFIYITVKKDCKLKSIILRFLRNFLVYWGKNTKVFFYSTDNV